MAEDTAFPFPSVSFVPFLFVTRATFGAAPSLPIRRAEVGTRQDSSPRVTLHISAPAYSGMTARSPSSVSAFSHGIRISRIPR